MLNHQGLSQPLFRVAHLSDLHIGYAPERSKVAQALCDALVVHGVDHVVVTGDLTERGRIRQMEEFRKIFYPYISTGRLTMMPGNHDRLDDEVAKEMMGGERVQVVRDRGMHLVRLDTTGPHNRWLFQSHGKIDERVIEEVGRAVDLAEPTDLVVLALHHHLLPLPGDWWLEHVSVWFHLPYAKELYLGRLLIECMRGKCDLILHGHRHASRETNFPHETRDLNIYNAGSSTELGGFRLFSYAEGKLVGAPIWVDVRS